MEDVHTLRLVLRPRDQSAGPAGGLQPNHSVEKAELCIWQKMPVVTQVEDGGGGMNRWSMRVSQFVKEFRVGLRLWQMNIHQDMWTVQLQEATVSHGLWCHSVPGMVSQTPHVGELEDLPTLL